MFTNINFSNESSIYDKYMEIFYVSCHSYGSAIHEYIMSLRKISTGIMNLIMTENRNHSDEFKNHMDKAKNLMSQIDNLIVNYQQLYINISLGKYKVHVNAEIYDMLEKAVSKLKEEAKKNIYFFYDFDHAEKLISETNQIIIDCISKVMHWP